MNDVTRIPVEIEPDTCVSPWWAPATIAVVVMVLANFAFMGLGVRHTTRNEERVLRGKWALATQPNPTFDWLIVGDSSGTLGVDPSVVSTRLSGTSVNLCTFGSMGVVGDLWIVEQYLKHHPPPRGVIVVHAADVWTGKHNDAFFQYAAAIPESTPQLLRRVLFSGARPSELYVLLRYRDFFPITMLKDKFRDGLGGSSDTDGSTSSELNLPPDGTIRLHATQANPQHVVEEVPSYLARISEATPLDWHNRLALNRLIDLARDNRFSLFIANGPIAKQVRDAPNFDEHLHGISSELATLASRERRSTCVLSNWFAFPPEQMENCNHVVGPAVDAYTEMLTTEILNSSLFNHSESRNGEAGNPAPL